MCMATQRPTAPSKPSYADRSSHLPDQARVARGSQHGLRSTAPILGTRETGAVCLGWILMFIS